MSDHKKHANSQFEINDLIDDAINNALARRSEALHTLSDAEANSIAGGTSLTTTVHGLIIKPPVIPKPYPPFPTIHGVFIRPPIIQGVVINPNH